MTYLDCRTLLIKLFFSSTEMSLLWISLIWLRTAPASPRSLIFSTIFFTVSSSVEASLVLSVWFDVSLFHRCCRLIIKYPKYVNISSWLLWRKLCVSQSEPSPTLVSQSEWSLLTNKSRAVFVSSNHSRVWRLSSMKYSLQQLMLMLTVTLLQLLLLQVKYYLTLCQIFSETLIMGSAADQSGVPSFRHDHPTLGGFQK